jgi:two-component system nitrate/nitrite response regulator NarL
MLHLSPNTVKNHLKNLFDTLGAADRAEAVAIGIRRGLIS